MASTVTAATATITISENIVLNGVSYGNAISKSFESQGEVIQRIMSVSTSFPDILYTSTVDGRGQVVAANWCYFRITNLDDTNFITLELYISATSSYFQKIEAGESFFLMSPDIGVDIAGAVPALADITKIRADADTSACDVEFLMITA
tara:strand:+ start:555 stop:1001 length:447 start_codon:yes stop_codon:yes gene_type:complete